MTVQTDDIVTRRTGPLKDRKGWVVFADSDYACVLWSNGIETEIHPKRLMVTDDTCLNFDWGKVLHVKS